MTALSVLIDERLADRAMRLGEYFRSSIRALNSPLVKEVRGRGLLNAVVIDEDSSKKHGKGRTAWQFCLLLKSRGVLAKPTHVNMYVLMLTVISLLTPVVSSVRFAPPLVIEEKDLEEAVKIIGECLIDLDQVSCTFFSSCKS
jgi:ornithine--oxo-acid transaminase